MMTAKTKTTATMVAAAGALMLFAAGPASAAPAQSFAPMKSLSLELKGDVSEIRHRRWHRRHCRLVTRCWIGKWGVRRCAVVRRCW